MRSDLFGKAGEGSDGVEDGSVDRLVSLVRKFGAAVLVLIPAFAISAGLYRSHERAEAQIAAFSQVTRDCLKRVLSDKGVPDGVCEPLSPVEFSVWQRCVEKGKSDQSLTAYPFEPDDEAFSSAVRTVEEGK